MPDFKIRETCRLCLGPIETVMELKSTPLANELVRGEDLGKKQDHFPLFLSMCTVCMHIQLPVIVSPERLFRHYLYVSGTSPVTVAHFQNYAEKLVEKLGLVAGDLIVEIGSNDGTLLRAFQKLGMKVLGIDPAKNIAEQASKDGIPTLAEFFTEDLAKDLRKSHGPAAAIVANNVFAHADDLSGIVKGIQALLHVNGVFVFEVSYLKNVVENLLFDTIYHEHLAYHSVEPLASFFKNLNMNLYDVEEVKSQGGSLRGYVSHAFSSARFSQENNVGKFIENEHRLGLTDPGTYKEMLIRINTLGQNLGEKLRDLKKKRKSIGGFGSPAKATTLAYQFDLDRSLIDYIVEDAPLKQGLYTPGKNIEIVPPSTLYSNPVDYLLILAWNFAESIIERQKRFSDKGGKFIVPLPEIREY